MAAAQAVLAGAVFLLSIRRGEGCLRHMIRVVNYMIAARPSLLNFVIAGT